MPSPSRSSSLPVLLLAVLTVVGFGEARAQAYFPPPGQWETRTPGELGIRADLLEEAIAFARENEATTPRDLTFAHYQGFGLREPLGDAVGPFKVRGDQTGVIIHRGYIVAEWGEPHRVDNTFSVTKSFLSSTVGLAWDRGLIPDLDEPVAARMAPVQVLSPECVAPLHRPGDFPHPAPPFEPFQGPHASGITWDHLLRQTSDWEGMLWCKPDWADRPGPPEEWTTRDRHDPGLVYEYNDVRVNLLALAAMNVWRRPLPQVVRDLVMDPIGASPTWRWLGYENSWVILDGDRVQSVSGGAHWGGGMFISARDMARFGYLHLRDGVWDGERILSEEWLELARTPGPANRSYGFMNYFLNTENETVPGAPRAAHLHLGAGTNVIYVDPEHDLVVVVRWIRGGARNEFLSRVLSAVAG
jgi:CubicO group peptidase (beta-lactamase class C family)